MAGFKAPPRRQVTVTYAGDLAGLVVTCRAASQGTLRSLARLEELSDEGGVSPQDAEIILGLFDAFARALVEWNLVDEDGAPVPATRDGIADQDDDFMIEVIMGWLATVRATGGGASYVDDPDALLEAGLMVEPLEPVGV